MQGGTQKQEGCQEALRLIMAPPGGLFFLQLASQDASVTAKHKGDHRSLRALRQDGGQLHSAQPGGAEEAPGARVC